VASGSAEPTELSDPQGGANQTFGAELGGGDFDGSGYESIVVGSIGDDSMTIANSCGAAYAYNAVQGSVIAREIDAPDCAPNEELGIAISQ
jgi:hypothetical protein